MRLLRLLAMCDSDAGFAANLQHDNLAHNHEFSTLVRLSQMNASWSDSLVVAGSLECRTFS